MNYVYLFDAAWLFLGGWIIVLLAVALIAFGGDVLSLQPRQHGPSGKPR